jgi:hypothetical protein
VLVGGAVSTLLVTAAARRDVLGALLGALGLSLLARAATSADLTNVRGTRVGGGEEQYVH